MNSPEATQFGKPDFSIWKAVYDDGFCVCTTLHGYENGHKLKRGVPSTDDFPPDAYFPMDPDFPNDLKLGDNIKNAGGFVLVSKRLKEALEGEVREGVEYLPAQIINHKGRLASADYFIVNPLAVYDALDLEKSVVKWNNINPDAITSISKLVLNPERVPADTPMFRVKSFERRVFLTSAVAASLTKGGFVGLGFTRAAEFRGF